MDFPVFQFSGLEILLAAVPQSMPSILYQFATWYIVYIHILSDQKWCVNKELLLKHIWLSVVHQSGPVNWPTADGVLLDY